MVIRHMTSPAVYTFGVYAVLLISSVSAATTWETEVGEHSCAPETRPGHHAYARAHYLPTHSTPTHWVFEST